LKLRRCSTCSLPRTGTDYGVDRLKYICETLLAATIDVDSVAAMLALAEQHGCSQLRRACIAFMASPDMLGAVMRTDGFRHLVASCPSVIKQILDKVSRVWADYSC
jgi:speckle-type POZ protein